MSPSSILLNIIIIYSIYILISDPMWTLMAICLVFTWEVLGI